jgi:flavorubredoxin
MTITNATKTLKMGPTNCYLLKSLDGYLLIDTSLPACFQPFLKELKKIKVDLSEIKYLLLTHSHDDHAGFAAELKEKTNCRIIAHKNSTTALKKGCIINVGRFLNRRAHITMSLYNRVKRRNFEYSPVTLARARARAGRTLLSIS